MAIILKDNQVLIIDTGDSCICETDYCVPVEDGDITAVQLDLTETTKTDLLDGEGNFSEFLTGTATSTAASKLIDAGATFQTAGVQVGATVYNETSNLWALVTTVDSEIQLSLDGNVFPSTEPYSIMQWRLQSDPIGDVEWSRVDDLILFDGNLNVGPDTCDYLNILTSGSYYRVTYTVGSYNQGTLGVYLGSTLIDSVTANGTYTSYGEANGTFLRFAPIGAAPGTFQWELDNVTLYEMGTIGIDIKDADDVVVYTENDGTSVDYSGAEAQLNLNWQNYGLTSQECYTVCIVDLSDSSEQETNCVHYRDDFDCSIKLTWTNGNNAFNFNYTDFTFVQVLRLIESELRFPKYSEESNRPSFSDGSRATSYGKSVKIEELQIEALPEEIHDALRLAVIHQTFTIDAVNYVKQEGDYEPLWDRSSLLSPVILEFAKASQVAANKEC